MVTTPRVLDAEPVRTLDAYVANGGGTGLDAARKLGPAATIDEIDASGLRGRGGAGFPTGTKWRTVAANASPVVPATVVVNGAEGEPGSFKDRAILRSNPYRVLEGALIAAHAVGADGVVVAVKASFTAEIARLRSAVDEVRSAGWADGVALTVHEGPGAYLYGEETALLEAINGRPPFPRVAPPFRHGVEVVVDLPAGEPAGVGAGDIELAGADAATPAPPTLVNNVETMAHVAGIMAGGPAWFRSVGTAATPGTVVVTISGSTVRHGVAEVATGTPLRRVIDDIGGGPRGRRVVAVLSGVSNPLLLADALDTPLDFDAMSAVGNGLGAAGFIVLDDTDDLVAVAHGVSRFLAVESCGQCTPCKQDGRAMSEVLERLRRSSTASDDLTTLADRLATVTDGARCYLAQQQQRVVESLLEGFPEVVAAHASGAAEEVEPYLVAAIVDHDGERFTLDESHATKQPDWTHDDEDSGAAPADHIDRDADPT
jgi:NADH:ubiquinone oxidoreductase subunit F (NADH-binding)